MSVTVVGSIAFDAVTTPFGTRERMLGGAAVHFALAASFFDAVNVVGPVGDDFGQEEYEVLRQRAIRTEDIERVPPGAPNFVGAGGQGREWGPRVVVATQGQCGAAVISAEGFFALPAFPVEAVVDATGAGDCFAGGLIGYLAAHPGVGLAHARFARA